MLIYTVLAVLEPDSPVKQLAERVADGYAGDFADIACRLLQQLDAVKVSRTSLISAGHWSGAAQLES